MGFLTRAPTALLALVLAGVCFLSSTGSSGGQHRLSATGDQLRALFVQRLVKYVAWPESDRPKQGEPFIIAATNPDLLRPYFGGDAKASFKLVQWPVEKCHVLVMTGTPERSVAAIMKQLEGRPILSVGQNPMNPRLGVIVNFVKLRGKFKLQINPQAASEAGLAISSRLMNIAIIYRGDESAR